MRRRVTILWLAVVLCVAGFAGACLAQNGPDIPLLTSRAQSGDIPAMVALGEAYLDGNGIKRDLDAAIGWFMTAAETDDIQALYLSSFALLERAKPGDIDQALLHGRAALATARKAFGPQSTNIAMIHTQLGAVYQRLGRLTESISAFEAARDIFEHALGKAHPQVGAAYVNLAIGFAAAGRFADALAANETALSTRLGDGESIELASLYMNHGTYLQALARYDEALRAFEQARSIRLDLQGDRSTGLADVLSNMSIVFSELTRFNDALEVAQKALAIHQTATPLNEGKIGSIHGNIGWAYQGLGRYDEARMHFQAAREAFESAYGPSSLEAMRLIVNLGNVDDDLGRYRDALASYNTAMDIAVRMLGPDHDEVAAVLARIANTSRKLGLHDDAIGNALQAYLLQARSPHVDLDNVRYTLRTLAQTLSAQGNRSAALLFAKKAVNAHQIVRAHNAKFSADFRSSLNETFRGSYRRLSELLLAEGLFSETQFAAGLLKQEEFLDFSRRGAGVDPGEFAPDGIRLTKMEHRLETDIARVMEPVHDIAADIDDLAARNEGGGSGSAEGQDRAADLLQQRTAAMRKFVSAARSLLDRAETERLSRQKEALEFGRRYAQELQTDLKAMGQNVVLFQAMSLEDGLHLFVSAAGRDTVHREIATGRPELAGQVFAAVSSVETRDADAVSRLAKLYDLLIRPVRRDIEAALDRQTRPEPVLLLDLSGFLRYVPFAALNDGGHFLVEDYALALFNRADPARLSRMDRAKIKGAGFGVTGEHPGFSPLPGVEAELETVFRGRDGIGFIDGTPSLNASFNEASLLKALNRRPQILHIASHFRFRPGNETNSYLLLGDGKGLSLDRLRTETKFRFRGIDLIILSACETARGGGAEGEEIESFGVLARINGASSVMATLWQIADESTARLIGDFYDGLITQGLDKANALRRAQLAMIKGEAATASTSDRSMTPIETANGDPGISAISTSHPYYWSAFILMGNWK